MRKLHDNRERLESAINTELGYAGLQFYSFKDIEQVAMILLDLLEQESKSRTN